MKVWAYDQLYKGMRREEGKPVPNNLLNGLVGSERIREDNPKVEPKKKDGEVR